MPQYGVRQYYGFYRRFMVFVWRDYCFASEDLTGMIYILKKKQKMELLTWNKEEENKDSHSSDDSSGYNER